MKLFRIIVNIPVRPRLSGRASIPKYPNVSSKIHHASSPLRDNSSAIERVVASPWSHSFSSKSGCEGNDAMQTETIGKKRRAWIALGSNLGNRIGMIEKACNEMSSRGIQIKRTSSLWETQPMYVLDQASFVNGVCEVETVLGPLPLLDALQDIENSMGRKKVIDKGPRNIDLDILLYENETADHYRLQIPHPLMTEREFVLRPLAELIPKRSLDPFAPWKITQDYLNALPPSDSPISTITPVTPYIQPIQALKDNRRTRVMAILNLTPDSFSDGGLHTSSSLSNTISSFISNGATIIDIGGQSSRPGAADISAPEETSRILPVISLIRQHSKSKEIAISIDTYRASVAEAAISAGADIINDVSAGALDPEMLSTVARLGCTVCLMHMRGTPATMNRLTYYPDGIIPTIASELLERVAAAEAAGIRRWRIILDPGLGFAKTVEQNLEILRRFEELRDWPGLRGLPWLVGSSRKGFVGNVTGVKDARERGWGTATTVAAAVQGGADIVRVHDVMEMGHVVKMADAIWRV